VFENSEFRNNQKEAMFVIKRTEKGGDLEGGSVLAATEYVELDWKEYALAEFQLVFVAKGGEPKEPGLPPFSGPVPDPKEDI
jgi:hypothetical protein